MGATERPMRRKECEVTDTAVIQRILGRAALCRVAMVDGNEPYLVPMNCGWDGEHLLLHAAVQGRKVDILRANGFTDRRQVIVGSFLAPLVQEVKDLAPEIATSLLVSPVLSAQDLITATRAAKADYVHLCWEARAPAPHVLLTPELLGALRAAGLGIVLWHEERPSELRVLRTLDVDAICTNTPDRLTVGGE